MPRCGHRERETVSAPGKVVRRLLSPPPRGAIQMSLAWTNAISVSPMEGCRNRRASSATAIVAWSEARSSTGRKTSRVRTAEAPGRRKIDRTGSLPQVVSDDQHEQLAFDLRGGLD
jgi:hypothetical protein